MKCSKCSRPQKGVKWFAVVPSGPVCNRCVDDLAKLFKDQPPPTVTIDSTGIHVKALVKDSSFQTFSIIPEEEKADG